MTAEGRTAPYRASDVDVLERAGEALMRTEEERLAIELFAIALRLRAEAGSLSDMWGRYVTGEAEDRHDA